jgi:CubicO group peptidase (beta-lactamase class C family)
VVPALPFAIALLAAALEPAPRAAAVRPTVASLVAPLIEAKSHTGVVVGVVGDGRREVRSFGASGSPARPFSDDDSVFEIGSLTKGFTALLVAEMVERGGPRPASTPPGLA